MKIEDFGLYGILTEPRVGYERLAAVLTARGVRFIQLRMKGAPHDLVRRTAEAVRAVIRPPSLFIVNDDPQIARDVGADGVHLGQDDMPYAEARALLGPEAVIGLSTHNPTQTRDACALGPDYIGVGPVFATPTKAIPDPVIGLKGMGEMLAQATVPAVCIGGIDLDNVAEVLAAGARNVCAVRAITQSDDPERVVAAFQERIAASRLGG